MNKNLTLAKRAKQDEFYTQYKDIEAELAHYALHFADKIIACNCDDPRWSNFSKYFRRNFHELKLRGLLSLFKGDDAYMEVIGSKEGVRIFKLKGNGDFRNDESVSFLKQADIIVTNPPFSLFRPFVTQLLDLEKQFLILGSANAATCTELFPSIQTNQLWLGTNLGSKKFLKPDGTLASFGNIYWYTNLDHAKRHIGLDLTQSYDPNLHPEYENYYAIEVSRIKQIPKDWLGPMGVPITFLERYSPDQFVILWTSQQPNHPSLKPLQKSHNMFIAPVLEGKYLYKRIFIQKRSK